MLADFITSAIATLLIVADPVLLSALFLGITHGMTKEHRREVAIRGCFARFLITTTRRRRAPSPRGG